MVRGRLNLTVQQWLVVVLKSVISIRKETARFHPQRFLIKPRDIWRRVLWSADAGRTVLKSDKEASEVV